MNTKQIRQAFERLVYYSVVDGRLVWNEWKVELPVVPDDGKVD